MALAEKFKTCPDCGEKNDSDAKICSSCGAAIDVSQELRARVALAANPLSSDLDLSGLGIELPKPPGQA